MKHGATRVHLSVGESGAKTHGIRTDGGFEEAQEETRGDEALEVVRARGACHDDAPQENVHEDCIQGRERDAATRVPRLTILRQGKPHEHVRRHRLPYQLSNVDDARQPAPEFSGAGKWARGTDQLYCLPTSPMGGLSGCWFYPTTDSPVCCTRPKTEVYDTEDLRMSCYMRTCAGHIDDALVQLLEKVDHQDDGHDPEVDLAQHAAVLLLGELVAYGAIAQDLKRSVARRRIRGPGRIWGRGRDRVETRFLDAELFLVGQGSRGRHDGGATKQVRQADGSPYIRRRENAGARRPVSPNRHRCGAQNTIDRSGARIRGPGRRFLACLGFFHA